MSQPTATIPTQRKEEWWQQRHQQKLVEREQCKSRHNAVDLLFLGDSITHAWEVEGEAAWLHYYAHQNCLNLGYAGDCTEHLLWRLQNGEIDGLRVKRVVLLIGTNNAGHRLDPPQEIAAGVEAILDFLTHSLPNTPIVLMAIFPRSRNLLKPMRQRIDASNKLLKNLAQKRQLIWLDINQHFLSDKGVLDESVMPDLLHPNAAQYWIWAEQLKLI